MEETTTARGDLFHAERTLVCLLQVFRQCTCHAERTLVCLLQVPLPGLVLAVPVQRQQSAVGSLGKDYSGLVLAATYDCSVGWMLHGVLACGAHTHTHTYTLSTLPCACRGWQGW